jgi:hypothetical protein
VFDARYHTLTGVSESEMLVPLPYENALPQSYETRLISALSRSDNTYHPAAGKILFDVEPDDHFSNMVLSIVNNSINSVKNILEITNPVYFATTDAPPAATASYVGGIRIITITWDLIVVLYFGVSRITNDEQLKSALWDDDPYPPFDGGDRPFYLAVRDWLYVHDLPFNGYIPVMLQACIEFVIYHELAHLYAGHLGDHPNRGREAGVDPALYNRSLERDADAFAVARIFNVNLGRIGATNVFVGSELYSDIMTGLKTSAIAILMVATTFFAHRDPVAGEDMTTHPSPPFRVIDLELFFNERIDYYNSQFSAGIPDGSFQIFKRIQITIWSAIARFGNSRPIDIDSWRPAWETYSNAHDSASAKTLAALEDDSFGNIRRVGPLER